MTVLAFTTLFLVIICLGAMIVLRNRMIELEYETEKCLERLQKYENERDELEKKLNEVCESLGYKEGSIDIKNTYSGFPALFEYKRYKLKKWDAVLDHLGIEWVEESKEGFVKKTKKSK